MSTLPKWPKSVLALTPEGQRISDDFMQKWHEQLPRFRMLERFNHGYPIRHSPDGFVTTLEIGAGIGGHLHYENLDQVKLAFYTAVELRPDMAAKISQSFPDALVCLRDCQRQLPITSHYFDRIIAIHVLEHLPDLPSCLLEMHRLCNPRGRFLVVIPCEWGWLYSLARHFTSRRMFEKLYGQSYDWFVQREHLNTPSEIIEELERHFTIIHRSFFPFRIPSVNLNLCIGLTLVPK